MPFVILKRVELYILKPAEVWKLYMYDRVNMCVKGGIWTDRPFGAEEKQLPRNSLIKKKSSIVIETRMVTGINMKLANEI
jgi:hypothetical protein